MLMTSTHTLNYVFLIFLLCISDRLYLKCKHNDTSQCVYLNMRFCFQSLFLIQIYYTCCTLHADTDNTGCRAMQMCCLYVPLPFITQTSWIIE